MKTLEKQIHIRALDGVKGICACVVAFIWHYQHFQPLESPFYRMFKLFYDKGDFAVEIFFMLSGFGMVLGYEKRIITSEISGKNYLLNCIKKIFPTMICSTTIVMILQMIFINRFGVIMQYPTQYFTLYHFVLNLLGIQCGLLGVEFSFNAPTWFVSVLLVCYFLYWLILYLLRNSKEAVPFFI